MRRNRQFLGYSFWLSAKKLFAPSHRQDSTWHGLGYTGCGTLAGARNNSMGPLGEIDPTTHRTMSERSTTELPSAPYDVLKYSNCDC